MTTRRDFLLGFTGLAVVTFLPVISRAGDMVRLSGHALGTSWHVSLPLGGDAPAIGRGIAAVLEAVDREMSPFRPDACLRRLNAAHDTAWHDVPPALGDVVRAAKAMHEASGGAFDPRVGPAVRRYGFGPIKGTYAFGSGDFELRGTRIRKDAPRLTLDLCGIAKGHAADRVAAYLAECGAEGFLVDVGGELVGRGRRPDGSVWRVGIEDPLSGGVRRIVGLESMALATSGDRFNAYEFGPRRYSHTIDPASGRPVKTQVASVSVIARDAMTADSLATALLVMGPDRGMALATKMEAGASYLLHTGNGLAEIDNARFRAHVRKG
jgi:thiamine biosynthesis lipoprotein